MNLRDVKLSTRVVIPTALAIPIAPSPSPSPRRPQLAPSDPAPAEDRVRTNANCPNYWL